jgi:dipeptidyl aminopeptidase/acylaminoacyl peptidase
MMRGALSADESIVVLEVMEDGDVVHPSLRSVDVVTGTTLRELRDPGSALTGFGFAPVAGDMRMAITRETTGDRRPWLWDARTGELVEVVVDLAGDIEPVDWWPDGSALLLLVLVAGRHRLYRYDIAGRTCTPLQTVPGSITAAAIRPDGEVWYRVHRGEHPARLLRVGDATPILAIDGPPAPAGQPMDEWWFTNPDGDRVHGFTITPEGEAPFPVILRVHGGPHSVDMDRWAPDIQAHVDAGFLVAMVNYRGSEGFGREWRDALTGNCGVYELEDVLAGLDDLVARGLADPSRVVLAGWSWGGYVTLMGGGRFPDRFASLTPSAPRC